jgi:gliding motility-associated-like protein
LPTDPYYLPYGIEFSNNSNLVYTTVFYTDPVNFFPRNVLLQYDLAPGTPAAIRASKQIISSNTDPGQVYAALQLAPDGKMYMARSIYTYISSIGSPNTVGPGCNFTANAVQFTLPGQKSSYGLPSFIQSYFYPVDSFTYVVNCPGLNTSFNYTPSGNVLNVLWDFGDPASGSNNSSTLYNPTHTFSSPGAYNVKMIKFTNCGPDTLRQTVNTNSLTINLGPDIIVCGGTSALLNAGAAGSTNTYLWQDGSTNPTFLATTAGLYWVQATNSLGCSSRDSIKVDFNATPPVFNLGSDTTICAGDTLLLNATVSGATGYLWSTGATTPVIKAQQAGTYWCEVNKGGCIFRDSLSITAVKASPVVNLGNDSTTCGGNTIALNATNANSSYLWQNGSTNPIFLATSTGLYWVEATHISGCIRRDSINLKFNPPPVFNLGADSSICTGDTLLLNATVSGALSYRWSTGAATPAIKAYQAGVYWCEVNNGCLSRDSLLIPAVKPSPVVNIGKDQRLCEGITVNLDATNPNSTYLWQDGSTNAVYTVRQQGSYFVTVNLNGCKKSDTTIINYNLKPTFTLGPDQFICQGNSITLSPVLDPLWQLSWQDGTTNPTYVVTQAGLYTLTATNSCGSTFDDVLFSNGVCTIFVPKAFTPNDDGLNDLFKILGTDLLTQFNLKIFNRYGQIVFETNDKSKGWDGRVKVRHHLKVVLYTC